ncbi:unnamed protein product, partial [Allacma fusca]
LEDYDNGNDTFMELTPIFHNAEVDGLAETSGISLADPRGTKNTKTAEPVESIKNGELCFRGEQVLHGYLDNEEATRNAVSPSELEEVLGKHPQIMDTAVMGIPDDRTGELPRAYVVRKDPDVTAEKINNYLQDKV